MANNENEKAEPTSYKVPKDTYDKFLALTDSAQTWLGSDAIQDQKAALIELGSHVKALALVKNLRSPEVLESNQDQ